MRPFRFVRASDPAQAAALAVAEPDTTYLAGGTNLVDLMKLGVARPARLVDITELPFDRIQHRPDGGTLVGATVRNADLAGDIGIRQRFPVLSEAVLAGASGQLRYAATTGGNLVQRTRCVYFQDITKPCNKRTPGAGCSAIEGHHRDLAVLGTSDSCVATHPSDMAVGMAALDAVVHVRRAGGAEIAIPLGEFYRLPGDTPNRETVLEHGDLITAVELPPAPPGAVMRYWKIRDRASYAFAVVSVAVVVAADADKTVRDVRIALGGVAPLPWRALRIERALLGQRPDEEMLRAAGEDEFSSARPLPHNAFKIGLAVDVVTTTVLDLLGAV